MWAIKLTTSCFVYRMGASFASSGSASSSGTSTPTRGLSLGTDPRVHGLGGQPVDALRSKFFGSSYPPR